MYILAIDLSSENIRSKNEQKKLIWESLLILAGTIVAIVLAGVEKRLIWEEKLQEKFRKCQENFKIRREFSKGLEICSI